MNIQFLSHEEVCELTGARTKAGQILNLKKNGVRHTIKVNGWPSVTVRSRSQTFRPPEFRSAR